MLALPIVGDLRELAPHLSPLVVLHQLAVNVRNRLAAKADALSVDDLAGLIQALCVLVVLRHGIALQKSIDFSGGNGYNDSIIRFLLWLVGVDYMRSEVAASGRFFICG